MKDEDISRLDSWQHGRISDEEFEILQDRLREDADLRAHLWSLAHLEEGLTALAVSRTGGASLGLPNCRESGSGHGRPNWLPWGIAVLACLASIVTFLLSRERNISGVALIHDSGAPTAVTAILVDEAAAVLTREGQKSGVLWGPGTYEVRSGTIHLRFINGADLVVEGPARFEIHNSLETSVEWGRMRAIVPPAARGFTLVTRDIAFEDVGTEFGLNVDSATGESRMQVFDGQVNIRRGDARGALLKSAFGGDSLVYRNGQRQTLVNGPDRFPSPNDIGHLRWLSQRDKRLSDPGLLAWYTFEQGHHSSQLINAVEDSPVSHGQILGARWATGRWPGKRALLFDREGDGVEIEIPGVHSELTISLWLKVDRLDHEMNALLNSDGHADGVQHLQLNRLGLPRGGLLGPERANQRWVGSPVPTDKWVQVTSVLSLKTRRHVIYVNGKPVMESEIGRGDILIQPGRSRIGSWNDIGNNVVSRTLRGLIDEVLIWNRALSAREIIELTEQGRPSLLWSPENPPLNFPAPPI